MKKHVKAVLDHYIVKTTGKIKEQGQEDLVEFMKSLPFLGRVRLAWCIITKRI